MKFEFNWPSGFREDVWKCWRTDGRLTDGHRSHWYTNSSPRSLRLRWAKNVKRLIQKSFNVMVTLDITSSLILDSIYLCIYWILIATFQGEIFRIINKNITKPFFNYIILTFVVICWQFSKFNIFKKLFQATRVSNGLDHDPDWCTVKYELELNCLHKLSADDKFGF